MRRTVRRGAGPLAALVIAACVALGVGAVPSRAVDPLPLPSIDLNSPLPSIDLNSPLPSTRPENGSPGASSSASPSPATSAQLEESAAPSSTIVSDDLVLPGAGRSAAPDDRANAAGAAGAVTGRTSIPGLSPPTPTLPDAGSWLIPVMGVAVPALIVALIVVAQVIGGAAGLRLARVALDRMMSLAPAWTRS
ncbi:MAG TPA: hypothetical protein VML96_07110 [Egibacteraceae bacterium]|nr:hypothetical protein [Egibacteraceae bacterium]